MTHTGIRGQVRSFGLIGIDDVPRLEDTSGEFIESLNVFMYDVWGGS